MGSKLIPLLVGALSLPLISEALVTDTAKSQKDVTNWVSSKVESFLRWDAESYASSGKKKAPPYDSYTRYSVYLDHNKYEIDDGDKPSKLNQGTAGVVTTNVFTGAHLEDREEIYGIFWRIKGSKVSGPDGVTAEGSSSSWGIGMYGLLKSLLTGDSEYENDMNWGKVTVLWEGNAVRFPTGALVVGDNKFTRNAPQVGRADQSGAKDGTGEKIKMTWTVNVSTGATVQPMTYVGAGKNGWREIP